MGQSQDWTRYADSHSHGNTLTQFQPVSKTLLMFAMLSFCGGLGKTVVANPMR